jgi:hypothetical protein
LFFDECEQIFLSRDKGGNEVNLLLTEIERHDGLIIMVPPVPHIPFNQEIPHIPPQATNRAFDLDEVREMPTPPPRTPRIEATRDLLFYLFQLLIINLYLSARSHTTHRPCIAV